MDFLFGIVGFLIALILFTGGLALGWYICKLEREKSTPTAQELSDVERKQLLETQEAYRRLHNYSVEDAYGMNSSPDLEHQGGDLNEE